MSESPTTAYAQSIAAARALMETVQIGQAELEDEQKRKSAHKRAARVWFDLLEELDPPLSTPDYWTAAIAKVDRAYSENEQMPLLRHMLLALLGYLEETEKREGTTWNIGSF